MHGFIRPTLKKVGNSKKHEQIYPCGRKNNMTTALIYFSSELRIVQRFTIFCLHTDTGNRTKWETIKCHILGIKSLNSIFGQVYTIRNKTSLNFDSMHIFWRNFDWLYWPENNLKIVFHPRMPLTVKKNVHNLSLLN